VNEAKPCERSSSQPHSWGAAYRAVDLSPPALSILAPFRGSDAYDKMVAENWILTKRGWEFYNGYNVIPAQANVPEELLAAHRQIWRRYKVIQYTRYALFIHITEADMRTNIVLDDNLIERAQKLTGIKTKREVVQEALRTLILLREQAELRSLRGKLIWEGNLSEMRQSRTLEH